MIIYTCGSTFKFYDIDTKETSTFIPPTFNSNDGLNAISNLTANPVINKFAFSETQLFPKVYVYDYNKKVKEQSVLLGKFDKDIYSIFILLI